MALRWRRDGSANRRAREIVRDSAAESRRLFSPREPTFAFAVVPVCQHGQTKVFGVARQETASIPCELEANPPEVSFTWKFNNTMEAVDIAQAHVTSDGTRSIASYTPMTELDYGTLLCWGSNDQGTQLEPCVYHIVPAGKCFHTDTRARLPARQYTHTHAYVRSSRVFEKLPRQSYVTFDVTTTFSFPADPTNIAFTGARILVCGRLSRDDSFAMSCSRKRFK